MEKPKTFRIIASSIVTYDKKKTFSGLAQILKNGDCNTDLINGNIEVVDKNNQHRQVDFDKKN